MCRLSPPRSACRQTEKTGTRSLEIHSFGVVGQTSLLPVLFACFPRSACGDVNHPGSSIDRLFDVLSESHITFTYTFPFGLRPDEDIQYRVSYCVSTDEGNSNKETTIERGAFRGITE